MLELEQFVKDKDVAVVGSAASIFSLDVAQQIDAHDIVIRMNLSIPGCQPAKKVGNKTDIWCIAKPFEHTKRPEGTQHILFMKLTKLGDLHWPIVKRTRKNVTRWPQELEDEVREFVGAPPGTGIRILYWLKRIAKPKSVGVYGMDCWDTPSSWSGGPAKAHEPALEKVALSRLLAT